MDYINSKSASSESCLSLLVELLAVMEFWLLFLLLESIFAFPLLKVTKLVKLNNFFGFELLERVSQIPI